MSGYLLDTDTASALLRDPRGRVWARIVHTGSLTLAISLVSAGELRFGAMKRNSVRLHEEVETLLRRVAVIALDAPVDSIYAELRADLERRGVPIGGNDLWIASHALALDRTLVTANTREFSRVPGLRIENWVEG